MVVTVCTKFVSDREASMWYNEKRAFALKHIDQAFIDYCDAELRIKQYYDNEQCGNRNVVFKQLCRSDRVLGLFVEQFPEQCTRQFEADIVARYLSQGNVQITESGVCFSRDSECVEIVPTPGRPVVLCVEEGESKKIYKIVTNNPFVKQYVTFVTENCFLLTKKPGTG